MLMLNKAMFIGLLLVLLCTLLEKDVCAYIDPGTGSYVFQVTVAFLLTAAFTAKSFWSRIKQFVVNIFSKLENKK